MKTSWKHLLAGLLVGLMTGQPALAGEWNIDYAHSRLGFTGLQGTSSFEGTFRTFHVVVDRDPAHPETGTLSATIDTGSITAGSSERDSYLPGADWFNTKAFPEAQFRAVHIHQTGDRTYAAEGTLTIKGVTQTVTLPFTLQQERDHWRASGKFPMLRTDFHIGEGDWSSEDYVKRAVDVVFDIWATRAP